MFDGIHQWSYLVLAFTFLGRFGLLIKTPYNLLVYLNVIYILHSVWICWMFLCTLLNGEVNLMAVRNVSTQTHLRLRHLASQ